jgi:hypothetical protein
MLFVAGCGREVISRTSFYSIRQQVIRGIIQSAHDKAYESRQDMEPHICIAIDSS